MICRLSVEEIEYVIDDIVGFPLFYHFSRIENSQYLDLEESQRGANYILALRVAF